MAADTIGVVKEIDFQHRLMYLSSLVPEGRRKGGKPQNGKAFEKKITRVCPRNRRIEDTQLSVPAVRYRAWRWSPNRGGGHDKGGKRQNGRLKDREQLEIDV